MSIDLLIRETVQSAQGGIWSYLSPSRLNLWLRCPLAFRLKYLDGIRPPTTLSLFLGKVTHSALEVFYRRRPLGIALDAADLSRRLLESWGPAIDQEGMKFNAVAEEQALQRQAGDLVSAYLAYLPAGEPRPLAVEAAVEMPLIDPDTGEDFGIPLLGIMGLVLDGQAGPVIADFKTSSKSAEPLEITHEIQLTRYASLFRQAVQRQEAGLEIRSLVKTKSLKIEFHSYPIRREAHFRRFFAVIREYLDALDCGRFNYRPGFSCAMCDYRETHCRDWPG